MSHRALERVKALNPDLKVTNVTIRAARTKGSAVFNILATGAEPKYTRLFLDALLDEFMIFRMKMLEEADGNTAQPQNVITVLQRATPAFENVEDWHRPIAIGAGGGGLLGGLVGLVLSVIFLRSPKTPQIPAAL